MVDFSQPFPAPMSTDGNEQASESKEAGTAKRSVLILAVAGGIVAGGAAGMYAIGPILAKRSAAQPVEEHAPAEPTNSTPIVHAFDNLVLNPAGTGGTRFLMVSATFELKDGGSSQLLKDREAEVRDRLLNLLGKKTIDQLSDIGSRDAIKKELLDSIAQMFPRGAIRRLYFPQFVIQ